MKRLLLFLLPILMIVAAVFAALGFVQVRSEEQKLSEDITRRAKAVAEGLEMSVQHVLATRNLRGARRIVDKFQNRDRFQGAVIYDASGAPIAVTDRFGGWEPHHRHLVRALLDSPAPSSGHDRFFGRRLFFHILPVAGDNGDILGAVEVIYDVGDMNARLAGIWRQIGLTLIVLMTLIILVAGVVLRQVFLLPVLQLTDWFRGFLKGEGGPRHPLRDEDLLGQLAREVEQAALSLRVARRAMVAEAREHVQEKEAWTEGALRSHIRAKLGMNSLLVVSNREPFMHVLDEQSGKTCCIRPASGVVSAIDPILRALGGTWIAHGAGNADRKFVNSHDRLGVPPEDNRYILRRVWLSKADEEHYYYGFSNEGLWPLCHITHTRPVFHGEDWEAYQRVNRKFADIVLEELPAGPAVVFIQDYHFALLPAMIKASRPDVVVAIFWHIPWPNPEVFGVCPFQKQLLDGMLGCDLIGFHVQYHCNNFLETANRLLECRVDTEKFSIVRGQTETLVRAFPISVAPPAGPAPDAGTLDRVRDEHRLRGMTVALGVDRIDYTKGIGERISAIELFLADHPEQRGKFVFVQIGAPSRTHIKRYHDLDGEIDALVEKVNWKYSEGDYKPIVYIKRHLSAEEISPFYALADICIVSSLHDGMNLVAKEFIAARESEDGILVLSCFTGAARELTEALIVNPYSTEEFAAAIHTAVVMPAEERKHRMRAMRRTVRENNIYRWAGNIVSELAAIRQGHEQHPAR